MKLTLAALIALSGCTTKPSPPGPVVPTITVGIYGQLLMPCDEIDCIPAAAVGVDVTIQSYGPILESSYDNTAANGMYQVVVPVGTYELCAEQNCTTVTLTEATPLLRQDYVDTFGWEACDHNQC